MIDNPLETPAVARHLKRLWNLHPGFAIIRFDGQPGEPDCYQIILNGREVGPPVVADKFPTFLDAYIYGWMDGRLELSTALLVKITAMNNGDKLTEIGRKL